MKKIKQKLISLLETWCCFFRTVTARHLADSKERVFI